MKKIILPFLIIFIFLSLVNFVRAQENPVKAHFFYGQTCPHCKNAGLFLDTLKNQYPNLEIESYEAFGDKENANLLLQLFEQCGKEKKVRVPAIFINKDVVIGYLSDETTGLEIENLVQGCSTKECIDPMEQLNDCEECACPVEREEEKEKFVIVPFIGKINLHNLSLPVLTIVLAGIDGFNPCAMWVLLFLLALLINIKSRRKMWLIGGSFILASGIVYYLLLTAWLNIFLAIGYVNLVRIIIGFLAMIFGVWQIKKFKSMKPGVCPTTENSKLEQRLKNHAEKIVATPGLLVSIFGVIALAVGVNFIEFFCSAGLPAIYTHILSLSSLSAVSYYLYLLFYTFIFMLDDLIIFTIAVVTLSKLGLSEKYSYWSTLIGGLIILILGMILMLKPELLMFGL